LRSAYLHVFADAVTSVLALVALASGKFFGFNWMDPFMGIVGAALIFRWSITLLRDTSAILLDRQTNPDLASKIKQTLESDNDTRVSDLHLLKVEQSRYACVIALVNGTGCSLDDFKNRLRSFNELVHVTIEVNPCQYNLN
jgi:cation diffusion facilitator family transporter